MAKRQFVFEDGYYYHVFNRGVEKKIIFHDSQDVEYFLDRLNDFNNTNPIGGVKEQKLIKNIKFRSKASELVKIVAFCLLPNHFHLILRQASKDGVSKFMQRVGTGYAKYYNKKYERSGSLFQGKFKAAKLNSNYSLQLLSVYVNLNYKHHNINLKEKIAISSLSRYVDKEIKIHKPCSKKEISNIVKDIGGCDIYKKYAIKKSKYFINRHGGVGEEINFSELE
jgi:REP element-mobilizing transposase RayT